MTVFQNLNQPKYGQRRKYPHAAVSPQHEVSHHIPGNRINGTRKQTEVRSVVPRGAQPVKPQLGGHPTRSRIIIIFKGVKPQNNFESAEVFGYKKRVQVSSAACLQGLNCSALDRVVTIAQLRLCPQQLSSGQQ